MNQLRVALGPRLVHDVDCDQWFDLCVDRQGEKRYAKHYDQLAGLGLFFDPVQERVHGVPPGLFSEQMILDHKCSFVNHNCKCGKMIRV